MYLDRPHLIMKGYIYLNNFVESANQISGFPSLSSSKMADVEKDPKSTSKVTLSWSRYPCLKLDNLQSNFDPFDLMGFYHTLQSMLIDHKSKRIHF